MQNDNTFICKYPMFYICGRFDRVVSADSRFAVCPRADASVVLPPVPWNALRAALPLSLPQRDEGLLGQPG